MPAASSSAAHTAICCRRAERMRSCMATSSAERIVVIAPSWLGDAVLARTAVGRLARTGLGVDVAVRGHLGRVFADLGVESLPPLPARRGARLAAAWAL